MSFNIKKIFLKNSILKIIILIGIISYNAVLGFGVVNKIIENRELNDQKVLSESELTLSNTENEIVTGESIYRTLALMSTINNVEAITKLDSSSARKIISSLQLDDLREINEECVVEFCIDVKDVSQSLEYLKDRNIPIEYISVDFSKITCRIFVGGGEGDE